MGGLRRVASYVDSVGERLIGWSAPPVRHAFALASWDRDSREAYCGSCGLSAGPGEVRESGCAACRSQPSIGDGFVRLGAYTDDLRHWVLAVKYQRWAEMGDVLGLRLGEAVAEAAVVDLTHTIVVPMPMPWQRRLYRGIDHAAVIAGGVGRALETEVVPCLSKRNGPPMVSLTATERAAMGRRGMRVRKRWGLGSGDWDFSGLDVVVVDDVRTTGATLRAAIRLLRGLHARRVVAAVVAVADETARRGGDPTLRADEPMDAMWPSV